MAFKIKNPSQDAGKIGKVMQGKARVFAPPGGSPPFYPHTHRPMNAKAFIFNLFTHFSLPDLVSFLPLK
jgi:hypothetical protein